jgi:hypothetical protein
MRTGTVEDTPQVGPNPGLEQPNRQARREGLGKRWLWLRAVRATPGLRYGARSFLFELAARSDEGGKKVWGSQAKLARQLECSVSSIQRWAGEAEGLGLLVIWHHKPTRGELGRYKERRTNRYYLRLPPKDLHGPIQGAKVPRAGRCVTKGRRSHLPVTDAARSRDSEPPAGSAVSREVSSEPPEAETGVLVDYRADLASLRDWLKQKS